MAYFNSNASPLKPPARSSYASPSSTSGRGNTTMAGIFGNPGAVSAANANPTQGDLSKDVTVQNPPEDSISDLRFSPASDHLAVASWDKKVRIYEIAGDGQSQGRAMFEHDGPVLNCCWSPVSLEWKHLSNESRLTHFAGRSESLWCWRGQGSTHARSRGGCNTSTASRCTRSAHSLRRVLQRQWQSYVGHWQLGQDCQVLGLAATAPSSVYRCPRTRL